MDSGANTSTLKSESIMRTSRRERSKVQGFNGTTSNTTHVGTIKIGQSTNIPAVVIPEAKDNFLAINDITKKDTVIFDENKVRIYPRDDYTIDITPKRKDTTEPITGTKGKDGLYRINAKTNAVYSSKPTSRYTLWHYRLGHVGRNAMANLRKGVQDKGEQFKLWTMKEERESKGSLCWICATAKTTRISTTTRNVTKKYSKKRRHKDKQPFELVCVDVCKVSHRSIKGYIGYIIFVCPASGWVDVEFVKDNRASTHASAIKRFHERISKWLLNVPKATVFTATKRNEPTRYAIFEMRADNEFASEEVQKRLTEMGTRLKTSTPGNSLQNGNAEKAIRDLNDVVRCVVSGGNNVDFDLDHWHLAVTHAVTLRRFVPRSNNKAPGDRLGLKFPLQSLRIFGCRAVYATNNNSKSSQKDYRKDGDKYFDKGVKATYVGVPLSNDGATHRNICRDGHLLIRRQDNVIVTRRDAIFDEKAEIGPTRVLQADTSHISTRYVDNDSPGHLKYPKEEDNVWVYWPQYGKFYQGVVKESNKTEDKVRVLYQDGDDNTYQPFSYERFSFGEPGPNGADRCATEDEEQDEEEVEEDNAQTMQFEDDETKTRYISESEEEETSTKDNETSITTNAMKKVRKKRRKKRKTRKVHLDKVHLEGDEHLHTSEESDGDEHLDVSDETDRDEHLDINKAIRRDEHLNGTECTTRLEPRVKKEPSTQKDEEEQPIAQRTRSKIRMIVNSITRQEIETAKTPKTVKEAISGPHGREWRDAINKEMKQLKDKGVFEVVKRSPSMNVIKSKIVLKLKTNADGTFDKRKARLVGCGYAQVPGRDFNINQIFAPVISYPGLRVIFAIANQYDMEIHVVDVVGAYLNASLKEDVFMEPPTGHEHRGTNKVLQLKKALYGLRQSAHLWNNEIDAFLKSRSMKRLESEPCIYVREQDHERTIIGIFVDDIVIASTTVKAYTTFKHAIEGKFRINEVKNTNILGIEIKRDRKRGTMTLSQRGYIKRITERFEVSDKVAHTPTIGLERLHKMRENETAADHRKYMEIVGSLIYAATTTRFEIQNRVRELCTHMAKPSTEHMNAAIRVLGYLNTHAKIGLTYTRNTSEIKAYCDASFLTDGDDSKSISGNIIFIGGQPILSESKKQRIVATSAMEAEYCALFPCVKNVMWIRNIMTEIGYENEGPTTIYEDNSAAKLCAESTKVTKRNRHIKLRFHYTRHQVEQKQIKIEWISTKEQVADILTKNLCRFQFEKLRAMLLGKVRDKARDK